MDLCDTCILYMYVYVLWHLPHTRNLSAPVYIAMAATERQSGGQCRSDAQVLFSALAAGGATHEPPAFAELTRRCCLLLLLWHPLTETQQAALTSLRETALEVGALAAVTAGAAEVAVVGSSEASPADDSRGEVAAARDGRGAAQAAHRWGESLEELCSRGARDLRLWAGRPPMPAAWRARLEAAAALLEAAVSRWTTGMAAAPCRNKRKRS